MDSDLSPSDAIKAFLDGSMTEETIPSSLKSIVLSAARIHIYEKACWVMEVGKTAAILERVESLPESIKDRVKQEVKRIASHRAELKIKSTQKRHG